MKYSGIDGVIIDWPGGSVHDDYPKNKQNAEVIMGATPTFGLSFAVIYEDQDIAIAGTGIGQAQADLSYVSTYYFTKPNYIKVNGAPLFMVFGPLDFRQPSQWSQLLPHLTPQPTFLTLWYDSGEVGNAANGEFAWIYGDFMSGLTNFYNNHPLGVKGGVAYPGFNSFYAAGGWPGTPNWTCGNCVARSTVPYTYNGAPTFAATLQLALSSGDNFVQLATWNDYGEGTMIEPTNEFQYSFLTTLQEQLGVNYTVTELELINTLYKARKSGSISQSLLTQASTDLANLNVAGAQCILMGGSNCPTTAGSSSSGGTSSSSSTGGATSGSSSSSGSGTSGGGTTSSTSGSGNTGGTGTSGGTTTNGSTGSSGGSTDGSSSGSGGTPESDGGMAPGTPWGAEYASGKGCTLAAAPRDAGWSTFAWSVIVGASVLRLRRRVTTPRRS
jgi:hypothetical protein